MSSDSLRIGIVGHRPSHPLRADLPAEIAAAFSLIAGVAGVQRNYTLVSGLAEGADQMAVHVKPDNWRLEGILPFAIEEYARDFAEAADGSKADQRPAFRAMADGCDRITAIASDRADSEAYHRSGLFMLGTLDLLVAVWNGEPPRGPGGTGDIVLAAAEAEIPVLWIDSGAQQPTRLVAGHQLGWKLELVCGDSEIGDYLRDYLHPAEEHSRHRAGHGGQQLSEGEKAEAFLREPWPVGSGLPVYGMMRSLLSPQSRRPVAGVEDPWADLLDDSPAAPQLHAELDREIRPLYERADKLAIYYANTYRSAYVVTYVAAFFAVALALAGLVVPHEFSTRVQVNLKALLVATELLIVGVIVGTVNVGTRNRWHQKWMDYRAMAETLRHVRFLAYLGAHRRFAVTARKVTARNGSWTNIMVDQVASRLGLPDATIDTGYIATLAKAVREHELETQIRYHTGNARRLHRMNSVLHGAGDWCFYLTAALLVSFLALYGLDHLAALTPAAHADVLEGHDAPSGLLAFLYASKSSVGVLAAALPALGAALSGIRFTGEFETLASRSEVMAFALAGLRRRYGGLVRTPDFDHSVATLMETSAVLSADIDDWKTLYTHKRLSLPA